METDKSIGADDGMMFGCSADVSSEDGISFCSERLLASALPDFGEIGFDDDYQV